MALNPEFRGRPQIPHTNLRSEATQKKLFKEGRVPSLLARYGELYNEQVACLIPAGKSKPAEEFMVSFEEARDIIAVRDKLQRLI